MHRKKKHSHIFHFTPPCITLNFLLIRSMTKKTLRSWVLSDLLTLSIKSNYRMASWSWPRQSLEYSSHSGMPSVHI